MIKLQGTKGSKTGIAATLLGLIVPGTDDWGVLRPPTPARAAPVGNRPPAAPDRNLVEAVGGHKVTVAGHTVTGKSWFHDIDTGRVSLFDNSMQPAVQFMGTYKSAKSEGAFGRADIAPAHTTLGLVPVGTFVDNGTMGRKVTVIGEDGTAISPGADHAWLLLFSGSVAAVADSTAVDSYEGEKATAILIG